MCLCAHLLLIWVLYYPNLTIGCFKLKVFFIAIRIQMPLILINLKKKKRITVVTCSLMCNFFINSNKIGPQFLKICVYVHTYNLFENCTIKYWFSLKDISWNSVTQHDWSGHTACSRNVGVGALNVMSGSWTVTLVKAFVFISRNGLKTNVKQSLYV